MKNYNKILLSLSLLLIFTLTACSKNENSEVKEALENTSYEISLYFPSKDYVESGNEENKFVMVSSLKSNSVDFVFDAVKDLKNAPKVSGESTEVVEVYPAIPEKITVNSVEVNGNTATVDLSSKDLSGGSLDEEILISSIFKTLTSTTNNGETFITGVQFTVDGETVQSLMGHFDVSNVIEQEI